MGIMLTQSKVAKLGHGLYVGIMLSLTQSAVAKLGRRVPNLKPEQTLLDPLKQPLKH